MQTKPLRKVYKTLQKSSSKLMLVHRIMVTLQNCIG